MAITTSEWSHVLAIPESYTPSSATSGQTLVITEGVIAKLSTGDQSTFWSNVQNGGGDVRICTDSGGVNQLPVEVVSLDNAAQTCVIWTRLPSYDGLGTLYLFFGKAGETQPPFTDPFGRNAVWQDKEFHNNFDGNAVDSTGSSSFTETSVTYTAGKIGQAVSIGATGSHVQQETGFTPLGLDDFKVSFWVRTSEPSNSNLKPIFGTTMTSDGSDNFGGTWMTWLQNGRVTFYLSNSGAESVENPKIVTDGSWHYVVARRISGVISLTVDNNAPVTKPSTRNLSSTLNSNRYGLSGRWASFIGDIDSSTLERGIVEDDYVATEYANQNDPAAFFGVPTLAETGGGVVDYTITLDSGSYSLQGNTLSLLSDRNLLIDNGSYTLTGQELNLALQRSITLSQGVYSQQGTDTSLLVDRSLRLNTGDYLLDGSLLDLLLERSISLQSGEYDYVGSSVNLQYGREFRLSLEQGSYSLQGSDSLLLKEHILSLDSSSYTYSADNISLLANRKITTDSGDYSYSGSPINFIYEAGGITYTLSIDAGSYSLTGESLKLLVSRRLPIDFGAYTYEGVDSKLHYNRVVALDSGVYSSAGTDLGIKVNRRLVFDNGNYSLQGTPITLSYTGEVLAILEGYNLSYKKHPVQSKYKTYNITARNN